MREIGAEPPHIATGENIFREYVTCPRSANWDTNRFLTLGTRRSVLCNWHLSNAHQLAVS